MIHTVSTQVIILGAGPVGLAAALELARFGVRSVLIEKHDHTSWRPRTRNFNTRTMEIAMGWEPLVYKRLRSIDSPDGWKSPILFLQSTIGKEFGRIESRGFKGPGPDVSPALPIMSSQDLIRRLLCSRGKGERRCAISRPRRLELSASRSTAIPSGESDWEIMEASRKLTG
jgi:2-polyprenyl-6-methoxyphenol hydroxylase-like FAD-dependent oxidoreductase